VATEASGYACRAGSRCWDGKVSRRALVASAAAAVAMAGCARPDRVLATFGMTTPLKIQIVGLPASQVRDLVAALMACQSAYEKASRGSVALRVTTALVPDDTWYGCSPPPRTNGGCPTGAYPASPAQVNVSAMLILGSNTAGQIGSSGVPLWLVRGRTRLDVQFGGGTLLAPVVSSMVQDWPDIVIGYDLWQYWFAPLAADLTEPWKTLPEDRQGLPANFQRYARFFSPQRGTFVAAFPLLRNPMMLANFDPLTPWTWPQVVSTFRTSPPGHVGFVWDTTGFGQSALYPEPTEWAAAMVVASGGTLATTTAGTSTPAFASLAAETGLRSVVDVITAGPPPPPSDFNTIPVQPTYMYNPLGGVRRPFGIEGRPLMPWPAGPVRTAVPCTYLCATVVAMGAQVRQAQDFASFLMHPSSQQQLVRWQGGLALRADQAHAQAALLFPGLPTDLAESLLSSANDLTSSDVFGGEKTLENAAAYDDVADGFASALAAIEAPGFDREQINAALQQAVSG
jgi:hypothetical protein